MSAPPPPRAVRHGPSLTRHLLLWSLGALVVVWGSFVVLGYLTGVHEADELTDGHLASTATLLAMVPAGAVQVAVTAPAPSPAPGLRAHDYQQSLSVVQWDVQGRIISRSGGAPEPAFSLDAGFADLQLGADEEPWRSFSLWDRDRQRKIMVLLAVHERDELAQDIAQQMIEPGLWLLPVVALALGLALHWGLRPLYALAGDVAALDNAGDRRLASGHVWHEFESVVVSINTLLDRQQAALARERRLAHEVAHELRTPLASIALQASALEAEADAAQRGQAVARIRSDALRAGHVLDQLLALARTARTQEHEPKAAVDLAALARAVAADHAQPAWQRGDELAVEGPATLVVQGHAVLLEMALRNLVENAIRHTPPSTAIVIALGAYADGAWLSVSDNGRRNLGAEPPAAPHDSLHLGLTIVARVAQAHGGSLSQPAPQPPHTTCYRMEFPQAEARVAG